MWGVDPHFGGCVDHQGIRRGNSGQLDPRQPHTSSYHRQPGAVTGHGWEGGVGGASVGPHIHKNVQRPAHPSTYGQQHPHSIQPPDQQHQQYHNWPSGQYHLPVQPSEHLQRQHPILPSEQCHLPIQPYEQKQQQYHTWPPGQYQHQQQQQSAGQQQSSVQQQPSEQLQPWPTAGAGGSGPGGITYEHQQQQWPSEQQQIQHQQ